MQRERWVKSTTVPKCGLPKKHVLVRPHKNTLDIRITRIKKNPRSNEAFMETRMLTVLIGSIQRNRLAGTSQSTASLTPKTKAPVWCAINCVFRYVVAPMNRASRTAYNDRSSLEIFYWLNSLRFYKTSCMLRAGSMHVLLLRVLPPCTLMLRLLSHAPFPSLFR